MGLASLFCDILMQTDLFGSISVFVSIQPYRVIHFRLSQELADAVFWKLGDGDTIEVSGVYADFHRLLFKRDRPAIIEPLCVAAEYERCGPALIYFTLTIAVLLCTVSRCFFILPRI